MRGLRSTTAGGRSSKLTDQQQRQLVRHLKRGARAAGYETDRWTCRRVQELIQREFGIEYHPKYVNRLLRRLGWTPQVPLPRAVERDEDLIRAWLEGDWARIKKGAAQRRRHRVLR